MRRLFCFLCVIFLLSLYGTALASVVELDRVIAVVNKEVITWSELYRAMEFEYGKKLNTMGDAEKREFLNQNEQAYLNKMIEMTLQVQEAERLGISVEEQEIGAAIDSIKKKYSMDENTFRSALKSEGFSLEDYKKRLGEQILIGKLVSRQVKEKILVTDQEIKNFINDNGLKQDDTETFHLWQILFPMPDSDELKSALEKKAREARARVLAGEDPGAVSLEFSAKGADLGILNRDMLAQEFLSVLDKLKPGDCSEPFWTANGLVVLKLGEKTPGDSKTALFQQARRELMEKRFEAEFSAWVKQLREKSFIEIRL